MSSVHRLALIGSVSVLLLCLFGALGVMSAPVPPKLVVNHSTKECGEIFGGDECMDCLPDEGWEVLGFAIDEGVECPDGYVRVDPPYTCHGFQDEFCCTEYHSGAPGNCENLVINRYTRSCAFVVDVDLCALPWGWKSRADVSGITRWECPSNYSWIDEAVCQAGDAGSDSILPLIVLVLLGVVLVLIVAVVAITLMIRRLRT